MAINHQANLSFHNRVGLKPPKWRMLNWDTCDIGYLSQRLVRITIYHNVFRLQFVHNVKFDKCFMRIAATQSSQRDKNPRVALGRTNYDAISETTTPNRIIEVLNIILIHRNNHGTILIALLERTLVVLLLSSSCLTTFTGRTRRLVTH